MSEKDKAKELNIKFGELANSVIDELLDNNEECLSRYRNNNDRVCIREYWLGVRDELNNL